MATFRGQPVPRSSGPLGNLHRLMEIIGSSDESDASGWDEFFDEAGGVELAELAGSFATRPLEYQNQLLRSLARFAGDEDWNRRESFARFFGALGLREADVYLARLASDPEPLVRLAASKALASPATREAPGAG